MKPSRVHLFAVAAARLEQNGANPLLIKDLRTLVKQEEARHAEGRTWTEDEDKRVDAQRTLFNMLPTCEAKKNLIEAMCQRAYDLMWDGDCAGCDAILQFLPSIEADAVLDAWENDSRRDDRRSKWYAKG